MTVEVSTGGAQYHRRLVSNLKFRARDRFAELAFSVDPALTFVGRICAGRRGFTGGRVEIVGGVWREMEQFRNITDGLFDRHGAANAIEDDLGCLSYFDVASAVRSLELFLLDHGVARGDVVAVSLGPSRHFALALLAAWRAGFRLLPLGPHADARVARCCAMVGPRYLLAAEGTSPPVGAEQIASQEGWRLFRPFPALTANPEIGGETAYIVFTSGSTGEAKGIMGRLPGVLNLIDWELGALDGLGPIRGAQLTPTTFDACFRDILVPLFGGGTLVLASERTRQDPSLLLEWLAARQINLLHTVPSVARLLAEHAEESRDASPWRYVKALLLAGEPLFGRDIARFGRLLPADAMIMNLYGPSETTMITSAFRAIPGQVAAHDPVPLGAPLPGSRLSVERAGREADAGEIGELIIETPYAASGYLDPAANDGRFAFDARSGMTRYRTGDLAVRDAGELYYKGRADDQVKIGGVLINLREIEQLAGRIDGVDSAAAVVVACGDVAELRLFFTSGRQLPEKIVGDAFRKSAPPGFWPSAIERLAALPLTVTGKVDRVALKQRPVVTARASPEVDPRPSVVRQAMRELFGVTDVHPSRRFLEIAGSSLQAMRMIAAVYRITGCRLSLQDLQDDPTIAELEARIAGQTPGAGSVIPAAAPAAHYPLSPYQGSMWELSQLASAQRAYTESVFHTVSGELSYPLVERTLEALVERHEILRTRYLVVDGEPRQVVDPAGGRSDMLSFEDLSGHIDAAEVARTRIEAAWRAGWRLDKAAPVKVFLFKLARNLHVVGFVCYHIAVDVRSVRILLEDAAAIYFALASGASLPTARTALAFKDICVWQAGEEASALRERQSAFWRDALGETPAPLDFGQRRRPALRSFSGEARQVGLLEGRLEGLRRLARAEGVSLFVATLAALALAIRDCVDRSAFVVSIPVLVRSGPELQDVVGCLVNTAPIVIDLADAPDFATCLRGLKATVAAAAQNADLPFSAILQAAGLKSTMSRTALFDVEFSLVEASEAYLIRGERAGLRTEPFVYLSPTSHCDLGFRLIDTGEAFEGRFEWSSDVLSANEAEAFLAAFERRLLVE